MKAKEYVIQKLLQMGKKHPWMKYPTLALISVISLFFLLVEKCMERPKRAVIALVCCVLIISQAWYLISLASDTNSGDMADTDMPTGYMDVNPDHEVLEEPNEEMQPEAADPEIVYTISYDVGANGVAKSADTKSEAELATGYALTAPEMGAGKADYFKFVCWTTSKDKLETRIDTVNVESFNGNNILKLYAYYERTAYKVTFNRGSGDVGDAVEVRAVIGSDGTAKVQLVNQPTFKKYGYTYAQWRINDSDVMKVDVDTEYTFGDSDIEVNPDWKPNPYNIVFESGDPEATGSMDTIQAYYGTKRRLPANTFKKTGYVFNGWLGQDGVTYADAGEVLNLTQESGGTFKMTAQWKYQTARLSTATLNYTFSDALDEILSIFHNEEGDGDFTPTFIDASGTTMNGTVTLDNLTELTGISVSTQQNQISLTAGSVQTVGTVVLTFNIHDNRNTGESDTSLNLTLNLGKRMLTVTGVDNMTKTYDGNCEVPIGSIHFTGANPGAQVTVNNASQKGMFTDPDVGTGKTITISDIYVLGADAEYYTVAETAEVAGGSITRRTVHVTTKPSYPTGQDYILTGQDPVFMVEVEKSDLPEAVADADEKTIKNAILGHYICDYGKPDYLPGENYRIGIDTKNEDLLNNLKNYTLEVTEGTLVVKQENPVYQDDYFISGNQLANNKWYYRTNPEVMATGIHYDMVYLTNDPTTIARTYEPGLFVQRGIVTEEMCSANKPLYVQLANSTTKAVTSIAELEIYVDITAPEIDTDQIVVKTVNSSGLSKIGNFLSFGNFFRENLEITVPVTDALSGTDKLIYYLDGDENGTEVAIINGTAVFRVNVKYKGTIALKSSDLAGNVSDKADMIGVDGSNYWVVEDETPDLTVTAKDAEGNSVYEGENYFYKTVNLTAEVQDMDAGVAYIEWTITRNGTVIADAEKETVKDQSQIINNETFRQTITESGSYEVMVTAYDNAGNCTKLSNPVTFVVDGTAPVIQISPENYDQNWAIKKTITFTVTDTESGVDMLTLKDADGAYPYSKVDGKDDTYTFDVTKKGTYTIKAVDRAGNSSDLSLVFEKVSSEVPADPVLEVSPELSEGQRWYTKNPTIRITEPEETSDGTKINTYYHIWKEGTEEPYRYERVTDTFNLPEEGIWNIRVWAETESGMRNSGEGLYQIYYDETAPVITDIQSGGNGNNSVISFKVQEKISGLSSLEVVYNDTDTRKLSFTKESDGTYSASFTAAMKGSYVIHATDLAGNVGIADAFQPMKIVVTGVTGNATSGMVISGKVYAGTFEVSGVSLAYGLADTGKTDQKPASFVITTDANGNKAFTAKLNKLEADSRYLFTVKAIAQDGQSCDHTGTFQTGGTKTQGITIAGTVVDETLDATDKSPIAVVLYNGNDIVQSKNVKNGDNFMFANVANGSYTVQAVNDNRVASEGVVIQNQTVIEPVSAIELVLKSGQATSVEYADETTPRVSVIGLENIFEDSTNFGSPADYSVIESGGIIEFCMKVNGLSESEIPESDRVALNRKMKKGETLGMGLDLSIWKRSIGAYGVISEKQVTAIAGGKTLRIVIPLNSELASHDNLSVIRIHDNKAERLTDLDTNPNTYTIESALFSTYAVVYSDVTTTDTATEDTATTATDNTAASTEATTEQPSTGGQTDTEASTRDISVTPKSTNISLQSGKNSSSPQTGDAAPIVWIGILGLVAAGFGFGICKKKQP